jgi:hypothetical protein
MCHLVVFFWDVYDRERMGWRFKNIFKELNEDRKKETERIAINLLGVQMIVDKERTLLKEAAGIDGIKDEWTSFLKGLCSETKIYKQL